MRDMTRIFRFHSGPVNVVTERVVLFKHPFHLCRIPALGRDGGVGKGGKMSREADESEQNKKVRGPPSQTPAAVRLGGDVTV